MLFRLIFITMFLLAIAGCATTGAKKETTSLEAQQLNMRIVQLERDVQEKDREISILEKELRLAREKESLGEKGSSKADASKAAPKEIQTALKNAGFYSGAIDGKIGEKTKKAIRKFQEANGLAADGVVGSRTWAKLEKFL